MRFLVIALLAAGCGKEIGDPCTVSSDCSTAGDRQCIDANEKGGYCTIQGCDYNTCPGEAACIRFYAGAFDNLTCTVNSDCSLDESAGRSHQQV